MATTATIGQGDEQDMLAMFIAAKMADFHWAARRRERWLGTYDSRDGDELDRVAIFGRLEARWFAGVAIVDGSAVEDLPCWVHFASEAGAIAAFHRLR